MKTVCFLSVLVFLIAITATAAVTGSFQSGSLAAQGVTPGGRVAVTGIGIQWKAGNPWFMRVDQVVTAAELTGLVSPVLEEPPPFQSIWIVVDLTSGDFGLIKPTGYSPEQLPAIPLPVTAARDSIVLDRPMVEVLLVRPRRGAWAGRASDGRPEDGDGLANGSVSIRLSDLQPVDDPLNVTTLPVKLEPAVLLPGDVILLVDPDSMRYLAYTFTGVPNAP